MNRRSFFRWVCSLFASIPFIGGLFKRDEPKPTNEPTLFGFPVEYVDRLPGDATESNVQTITLSDNWTCSLRAVPWQQSE